jgi:hypothetical protein
MNLFPNTVVAFTDLTHALPRTIVAVTDDAGDTTVHLNIMEFDPADPAQVDYAALIFERVAYRTMN